IEQKKARGRKLFWLVIFCAVAGDTWHKGYWQLPVAKQDTPATENIQAEAAVHTTALTPLRKLPSPAALTLVYVPAQRPIEVQEVAPRGAWLKITYQNHTGWIAGAQTTYNRDVK